MTGMAQRSARAASARTASDGSTEVMINGRSAPAIHSANVAMAFGSGCTRAAAARGLIGAIGSATGADNGSRGSTR